MSAVHPQHLVLRRVEAEAASRMETDEKRGLSPGAVQRWDHPGFAYLRFLLCFPSLPPLNDAAEFSLDQTSGTPRTPAP